MSMSGSSLIKVMHSFLPHDIIKSMKFKENGEVVCSYPRFKYFGPPDELEQALSDFRQFTGSSNFFNMEVAEPYCMDPFFYTNSEDKQFLYKQDLFVYMQQLMDWKPMDEHTNLLISSLMAYVLKTWESRLDGTLEMVPVEKEVMEKFAKQTLMNVNMVMCRLPQFGTLPTYIDLSYEAFFKALTSILPENDKDPDFLSLLNRINEYAKHNLFDKHPGLSRCLESMIIIMVQEIEGFIYTRPDLFVPYPTDYVREKEYVRVFLNCERKCLMAYELMPFLTEASANFVKKQAESGLFVAIWDDKVNKEFKDAKDYIEFVECSVYEASNRAVYIPSIKDKYCILASDLLFEVLGEMISFKGIFQNINKDNVNVVEAFFKIVEPVFSSTLPGPFFVSTGAARGIRKRMNDHFDEHKELFGKMRKVRKVGPKGFTLDDVKAEVRHLGLKDGLIDYEIDLITEFYYECMIKKNVPMNRMDAGMHKMIEDIQLICVLRYFPKLHKFTHLHGVCNRTPFECKFCHGTQIRLTLNKSEQILFKSSEEIKADKVQRGLEKSMENLTTS